MPRSELKEPGLKDLFITIHERIIQQDEQEAKQLKQQIVKLSRRKEYLEADACSRRHKIELLLEQIQKDRAQDPPR